MARRIVVFAPHFAEYATRLALALSRNVEVLLILEHRNRIQECGSDLWSEAKSALQILEYNSVGRWNKLRSLSAIVWQILRFRPDLMNVQEQIDSLTATVSWLFQRILPIVLTIHDPIPHTGSDTSYVLENLKNRSRIRNAARAFHAHGRYCAEIVKGEIDEDRPILETQHGVLFVPRVDQQQEPHPRSILMFGRMENYKGLETLLNAFSILSSRKSNFTLTIAGRGPELERLRKRIQTMTNTTVLEQFFEPDEVVSLIQNCAAVVTPYDNATQSGVISAAYGNGRPVIASRSGGLTDSVAEGVSGLLFPPGDADALAIAVQSLFSKPQQYKSFRSGAESQRDGEFSWAHISDMFLAFVNAKPWMKR